jgi:Flp pilus assembly pilin Flp
MRTSWLVGLVAVVLLALVVSVASMLAGSLHETWSVASQGR